MTYLPINDPTEPDDKIVAFFEAQAWTDAACALIAAGAGGNVSVREAAKVADELMGEFRQRFVHKAAP